MPVHRVIQSFVPGARSFCYLTSMNCQKRMGRRRNKVGKIIWSECMDTFGFKLREVGRTQGSISCDGQNIVGF